MIVVSPSVVLSDDPNDEINENNPVIGWHNILDASMLTADEEDADHPISNLANPATFLRWQGTTQGAQNIVAAINSAEDVDYVGIASHNFGSSQISVTIEGSIDGVNYDPLVGPVMLGDDSPAMFRFTPQALTHIRIALGAGNAIPRCAAVYIGELLVMPRRIYVNHVPIKYGRVTQVTNGRSESGNFLGRIVTGETRRSNASFNYMEPDWVREELDPFLQQAQERPFFFAWRPGSYPMETGYAWLTSDAVPVNSLPNGMVAIDFEMQGVA